MSADPSPARNEPWRAVRALNAPRWLDLQLEHRSRFEHLTERINGGLGGPDSGLSLRTRLDVGFRADAFRAGVELLDSRIYLLDRTTPVGTSLANPLDLLRAYVGFDLENLLVDGDALQLRVGRLTLDIGSRRLVARNRFRNTINAFTGIDLSWRSPAGDIFRGFATFPVQRRPAESGQLRDLELQLDVERTRTLFWGLFYRSAVGALDSRTEVLLLGLHESDETGLPATSRRTLGTGSFRVIRLPDRGSWDAELEAVLQFGASRSSSSSTVALDHLAFFAHATAGYTFDAPAQPRVSLRLDFATGDEDPTDRSNQRFDRLFGAQRFELGPSGIYGLTNRGNLGSVAVRVDVRPTPSLSGYLAFRSSWLFEAADEWLRTGLRDGTGRSDTSIGHQLDGRLRWRIVPGNLLLEGGGAVLFLGGFPRATWPNPGSPRNPVYGYVQLILTI